MKLAVECHNFTSRMPEGSRVSSGVPLEVLIQHLHLNWRTSHNI
jgi:hypothetical protein